MNLLLDTHAFFWWMTDDERLPPEVRARCLDERNPVSVSAASVWELEIKGAGGKLHLDVDMANDVAAVGFQPLTITFPHAVAAARLPLHHADPFDRMLVAQAQAANLVIVSNETVFDQYGVTRLW